MKFRDFLLILCFFNSKVPPKIWKLKIFRNKINFCRVIFTISIFPQIFIKFENKLKTKEKSVKIFGKFSSSNWKSVNCCSNWLRPQRQHTTFLFDAWRSTCELGALFLCIFFFFLFIFICDFFCFYLSSLRSDDVFFIHSVKSNSWFSCFSSACPFRLLFSVLLTLRAFRSSISERRSFSVLHLFSSAVQFFRFRFLVLLSLFSGLHWDCLPVA